MHTRIPLQIKPDKNRSRLPMGKARLKLRKEDYTMPKQKSHRGAAKRFSFTKSGIVKHKQMNANHQVRLKTTKRTRHLRADGIVDNAAEARTIHKLLPYK